VNLTRVGWGRVAQLPEWKDFGRLAWRGLWAFVAMLPYSLVVSVIAVPVMVALLAAGVAWLVANGDPTTTQVMVFLLVAVGGSMGLMLGSSYLVTPLSFSAIARVALYDRLEAGFEFKEIWRRVRLARAETARAWLYTTTLGFAIVLPATLLAMTPYALIAWLSAGGDRFDQGAVAITSLAATVLAPLAYLVVSFVGVVVGLANQHWWGTQARVAYGLADAKQPR
jgi:hypothetical protein